MNRVDTSARLMVQLEPAMESLMLGFRRLSIQLALFIVIAIQGANLRAAVFLGVTGTASVEGELMTEGQTVASIHETLVITDPLKGFGRPDSIHLPWTLKTGDFRLQGDAFLGLEATRHWSYFPVTSWYEFALADTGHNASVFPGEDPSSIGWDVVMDTQITYRMRINDIRERANTLQRFGSYRSDFINYDQSFESSTFESTWRLLAPVGELASATNEHESSFQGDVTSLTPGILELRTSMRTHFWRDENSEPGVLREQDSIFHYAIANFYVEQVVPEPQLAAMLIWVTAGVRRRR